jgi:hypothetical protein
MTELDSSTMEEARKVVVRDQAAVVRRALAEVSAETQREVRRHRVAALLVFFLLGGCWRFFNGHSMRVASSMDVETAMTSIIRPVQGPPGLTTSNFTAVD